MSNSEIRFRSYLKKNLDPMAYIKKVSDFKQLGHGGNAGLPDYLVITKGKTTWYEVKQSPTKTTFNFNLLSEDQWIEFTRLSAAGAAVFIAAYINKELFIIPYKLLKLLQAEGHASVDTEMIEIWKV